jgi:hypothetical protein
MALKYIYSMVLTRPSMSTPWFEEYLVSRGETAKLATFTKKWNEYNTLLKMSPSFQITSTDLKIAITAEFSETEFYATFQENTYSLSSEEQQIYQEFLAYNKNNGLYNLTTMSEFFNNAPYDPSAPYIWLESTDDELKQQFRNARFYAYSA